MGQCRDEPPQFSLRDGLDMVAIDGTILDEPLIPPKLNFAGNIPDRGSDGRDRNLAHIVNNGIPGQN